MDKGEAYEPGIAKYEDGTVVDWFKYGRATQAHFAVIDTLKRQDKSSDNHSSKHIVIPLTVGRLMTILDSKQITNETKTIRVKIEAEAGFNPHTDIDLNSLRFGASEEVNFGKGCKVAKTEKSGDDLIITFKGKGNGLTDDNFTAKLLGKTSEGKLLFAYARLPWLNYLEPALSALQPKFTATDKGFKIIVEVQNFGQVKSKTSKLKIVFNKNDQETEVASEIVPILKPFEKTIVELSCGKIFEKGISYNFKVVISSDDINPVTLQTSIKPIE